MKHLKLVGRRVPARGLKTLQASRGFPRMQRGGGYQQTSAIDCLPVLQAEEGSH
jgi:hypothetical protein